MDLTETLLGVKAKALKNPKSKESGSPKTSHKLNKKNPIIGKDVPDLKREKIDRNYSNSDFEDNDDLLDCPTLSLSPDKSLDAFLANEDLDISLGEFSADFTNRKEATLNSKKIHTGSFEGFKLNSLLLRNIKFKRYNQPTPIQRKTIPIILEGKDVVAMAKTGSGKTAAFVLPLIQKLLSSDDNSEKNTKSKTHKIDGIRGLILSPNRELAMQTLQFVKDFSRGSGLSTALIIGGTSLDTQFAMLEKQPNIIVATPGRFLHVKVEMTLNLSSLEYVVFDEADSLFEMGFSVQLNEILHAIPKHRQTLLFSATLPATLVEFAKAGLQDPILLRLDTESKISEHLQSAFIISKSNELDASLLYILQRIIGIRMKDQLLANSPQEGTINDTKKKHKFKQTSNIAFREGLEKDATMIFMATKYHVEYMTELLMTNGYAVSQIYSSLDQTARKIQLEKFRSGATNILIVTDVAGRGIDIPSVGFVINFDFPPHPKIFVHRVGRTARAGRTGWAYSLVTPEDLGYLEDLKMFLGREIKTATNYTNEDAVQNFSTEMILGGLPREDLGLFMERVSILLKNNLELSKLHEVCIRAYKLYKKTRPKFSSQGVKQAKKLLENSTIFSTIPLKLEDKTCNDDFAKRNLVCKITNFKPKENIFEIKNRGSKSNNSELAEIMKARREKAELHEKKNQIQVHQQRDLLLNLENGKYRDEEHFIPYQADNLIAETAYNVNSTFSESARSAIMDLTFDESNIGQFKKGKKWDSKKKKYVLRDTDTTADGTKKKFILSESGQKISASFKSGKFQEWKQGKRKSHLNFMQEEKIPNKFKHKLLKSPKAPDRARDNYEKQRKRFMLAKEKGIGSTVKSDLKSAAQIVKSRKVKERRKVKNARPSKNKRFKSH